MRIVPKSSASNLPVRDLADVPLAALFDEPGCPLCRRVRVVTERYIDGLLYESVNDVAFRAELDAARGFCARHTHEVLAANRGRTGGSLSSAILFGAVLRVRRREVEAVRESGGRGRSRRVEDAVRGPSCPICLHSAGELRSAIDALARLSAEPAWADALGSAPFCLDHLVRLMAARPGRSAGWEQIEARQAERLASLQGLLEGFAHHSSEDRRHLLTDEERASVDEAARLLGGET